MVSFLSLNKSFHHLLAHKEGGSCTRVCKTGREERSSGRSEDLPRTAAIKRVYLTVISHVLTRFGLARPVTHEE